MRHRCRRVASITSVVFLIGIVGNAHGQQVVLCDVPTYPWHHGCSPTAGMMVLGYWDAYGYGALIPGSNDWNANGKKIGEAIASSGDGTYTSDGQVIVAGTPGTGHIPDYALYEGYDDSGDFFCYSDLSEIAPPVTPHSDNCLADFMHTSKSVSSNHYGETKPSTIAAGLAAYADYVGYELDANHDPCLLGPSWSSFTREIESGRPVVLNVDINGNVLVDHSVAALAYRETGAAREYGYYEFTPLGPVLMWHPFLGTAIGREWGISSMDMVRPVGTRDTTWTESSGWWADSWNWSDGLPDHDTFASVPEGSTTLVDGEAETRFLHNIGTVQMDGGILTANQIRNPGTIMGYGDIHADIKNYGEITGCLGNLTVQGDLVNNGRVSTTAGWRLTIEGLSITDGVARLDSGDFLVMQDEFIGYTGQGWFTQTGGSHVVPLGSALYLGCESTSTGYYDLSGGELQGGSKQFIGHAGDGHFTQAGGNNRVPRLYLGWGSESQGTYELSGDGQLYAWREEFIGYGGEGYFTQRGGYHYNEGLFLGTESTGTGSYELSDGELHTWGSESVGQFGTGNFTQNGGTHWLNGSLRVGVEAGSRGTYCLENGDLTVGQHTDYPALSAIYEAIGCGGIGEFIQTGGTHVVKPSLRIGSLHGGSGTYELINGILHVYAAYSLGLPVGLWGPEEIGHGGTGVFLQAGGVHRVDHILDIGSTGAYELTGGELLVGQSESIASGGTFTQSAGSHTVYGPLYVDGAYDLVDTGELVADEEHIDNGVFRQYGGINAVRYLSVGSNARYEYAGGVLQITAGMALAGEFDFAEADMSLNVSEGAILDFHQGVFVNAQNSSLVLGPNTLTIISPGFDPETVFRSFTSGGIIHPVGTTLLVPNGKGFNGSGTITDSVVCEGAITIAENNSVNVEGSLHVSCGGTVEVQGGTLVVDAGYTQTGGLTKLAGGTICTVYGLNIEGGQLVGSGKVEGDVSIASVVSPGCSVGALFVDGDYLQDHDGTLLIELSACLVGQYDALDITGTAFLGGTFDIHLIDGFIPEVGDTFEVLHCGSRSGEFGTVIGRDFGSYGYFDLQYSDHGLTLLAVPEPSTLVMAVMGCLGLFFSTWRRYDSALRGR